MEKQKNHEDEIDLLDIFKVLWKRKKIIIWGTIILTLISIIISFLLPKVYKSDGFYLISKGKNKISSAEFKRYSSSIINKYNLADYLLEKNIPIDRQVLKNIVKGIKNIEGLYGKVIGLVYAYSKEDMKDMAATNKSIVNYIVGLNLGFEHCDPVVAKKIVEYVGEYCRVSIMKEKLNDYVRMTYSASKRKLLELENDLSIKEFNLSQLEIKKDELIKIRKKYFDSKGISEKQQILLLSAKETNKLITPLDSLLDIDISISVFKIERNKIERARKKARKNLIFFTKANKIAKKEKDGEKIFYALDKLKDDIFTKEELKKDVYKETYNSLSIQIESFYNLFYNYYGFVSVPTLPEKPIKPKKKLIVIISFFLSFFIFIFFAFIIEWWTNNKKNILKK